MKFLKKIIEYPFTGYLYNDNTLLILDNGSFFQFSNIDYIVGFANAIYTIDLDNNIYELVKHHSITNVILDHNIQCPYSKYTLVKEPSNTSYMKCIYDLRFNYKSDTPNYLKEYVVNDILYQLQYDGILTINEHKSFTNIVDIFSGEDIIHGNHKRLYMIDIEGITYVHNNRSDNIEIIDR